MKTALITGASGQDSIELSHYLLGLKYKVYVTTRRSARQLPNAVKELSNEWGSQYQIINGDITDMSSIIDAINIAQPDEFYNLAAQSHVGESFKEPLATLQITGIGVANCLEAIRKTNPKIRFYQAGSSEQFGNVIAAGEVVTINEETPMRPVSPYGAAKLLGHNMARIYRESYGLHASVGILFNHEGIYRKPEFVTRKVSIAAARIALGLQDKLQLGTLDFKRDWGWAKDYVCAMHLMLQQDKPDDYIIATGKLSTGKELLEAAFGAFDLDWHKYVELSKEWVRPNDLKYLVGDASKAKEKLQWKPSNNFGNLIYYMCQNDWYLIKTGKVIE